MCAPRGEFPLFTGKRDIMNVLHTPYSEGTKLKYTPMIEQYLHVKKEAQDAFLFFRLGDFYEMFFDDAILAAKELEITLTGREGGAEERIPMCGVPHHAAEGYIARLIEKGYKVAVCEQVEDPSQAKGVVRREIVRVVTPGTVMEEKVTVNKGNNFIAAVTADGDDYYSFSVCDLSTGELYVGPVHVSFKQLLDELAVYEPCEVIGEVDGLQTVQAMFSGGRAVLFTKWAADAEVHPESFFAAEECSRLSEGNSRAVSVLMSYFLATQRRAIQHITRLRFLQADQYMHLDPFTRRNLELVETVRDKTRQGSLLHLLDKTMTSIGSRMLRRWIDKPLRELEVLLERQEAVECLYNQLIVRDELRALLKEIYDLERLVSRVSFGNANARDLLAIERSLATVPHIRELCLQSGSLTLVELAQSMDDCADVRTAIQRTIVDEPPVSTRDGGMIRSGCDDYLDQLREASANGKQWIAELERQERERTGIKSLKVSYNKVFGYYIEITKANLGALPEGVYERKQTLANAERFITPELKEKESLILAAEEKMVDLEYQLFVALRTQIAEKTPRLQVLAELLATVDVYQALATVSAANRFVKPELTADYDLHIREGRHPVVEAVLERGAFIANETQLEEQQCRLMLITGPNMAGKSTYMRQVAMICILAQIGCFVPAKAARVPLLDRIFTRIGAADDLVGGQSTFMVEMMDIQTMTAKATADSLVIIDELGRGTSTSEGMAIAQAVIEFLHDNIGCKTLVSTHFHELAHVADHLQYVRNFSMAVKESGQQVTFLRKLVEGAADTSYGIYCAQIAGLPNSIIGRAYELQARYESRTGDVREFGGHADAISSSHVASRASAEAGPHALQTPHYEPVQLSLFDIPTVTATEKEVLKQLQSTDLMSLNPLQALNILYEWQSKLK